MNKNIKYLWCMNYLWHTIVFINAIQLIIVFIFFYKLFFSKKVTKIIAIIYVLLSKLQFQTFLASNLSAQTRGLGPSTTFMGNIIVGYCQYFAFYTYEHTHETQTARDRCKFPLPSLYVSGKVCQAAACYVLLAPALSSLACGAG